MALTRRQLLQMMGAGGAAVLLPLERAMWAFAAPSTPRFAANLKRLPVLAKTAADATTDYYDIEMRPAAVTILPGKVTPVWAYNGLYPGPTIKARSRRRVVVTFTNRLGVPTTVHNHGANVPAASDGHPTDLIAPGGTKVYEYPNTQVASTLWYHDHAAHSTSRNVYMGLAGAYLIGDRVEAKLNLPRGHYDIACIIQDRSFRTDGSLDFVDDHNAVFGDTILVNGRPWPRLAVAGRRYRFRFVNGSNTREYELALDSGDPLTQIASDGGLLSAPFTTPSIRLSPGERAEVVIDFAGYPAGSRVVLKNLMGASVDGTDAVMRFDVGSPESDPSALPSSLRTIERLPTSPSVTRRFTLSMDPTTALWVINGLPFDAGRIDVQPRLDVPERWVVTNTSGMAHPFHIHLAMFQLLKRGGSAPSAGERDWKDTVRVDPGSSVEFVTKFTGYTGRYVYHCHNLAHEDHDMMAQMRVLA